MDGLGRLLTADSDGSGGTRYGPGSFSSTTMVVGRVNATVCFGKTVGLDDIVADIRENLLGNIIDRFYEAAGQPELWSAVLEEMLPVMGAEGALIMPGPKAASPPVWTSSLNEMRQFGINEGWYENNARVARGVAAVRHAHDVITESMIFSQQELEHIPYNAEFINRSAGRTRGLDRPVELAGPGWLLKLPRS